MNPAVIIFLVAPAIVLFLIFLTNKAKYVWPNWNMRNYVPVKIGLCKEGDLVKIQGNAITISDNLLSPLTGRTCLMSQTMIYELKKNSSLISNKKEFVPFLVKDESGLLYVDPELFTIQLSMDKRIESGTFNNPSSMFQKYLSKLNIKSTNLIGMNRNLVCKEGVLEEGAPVSLTGKVKWTTAESLMLPQEYSGKKVLELTGDKYKVKFLSNTKIALSPPQKLSSIIRNFILGIFDRP